MDNLVQGPLTLELSETSEALECTWLGKSSERQPGQFLAPYFEKLLAHASEHDIRLEMRFDKLDHFNSSTITAVIRLIQKARASKVKLVMLYDQNLKWQRLGFDALRVFDKGDDMFELRAV